MAEQVIVEMDGCAVVAVTTTVNGRKRVDSVRLDIVEARRPQIIAATVTDPHTGEVLWDRTVRVNDRAARSFTIPVARRLVLSPDGDLPWLLELGKVY